MSKKNLVAIVKGDDGLEELVREKDQQQDAFRARSREIAALAESLEKDLKQVRDDWWNRVERYLLETGKLFGVKKDKKGEFNLSMDQELGIIYQTAPEDNEAVKFLGAADIPEELKQAIIRELTKN